MFKKFNNKKWSCSPKKFKWFQCFTGPGWFSCIHENNTNFTAVCYNGRIQISTVPGDKRLKNNTMVPEFPGLSPWMKMTRRESLHRSAYIRFRTLEAMPIGHLPSVLCLTWCWLLWRYRIFGPAPTGTACQKLGLTKNPTIIIFLIKLKKLGVTERGRFKLIRDLSSIVSGFYQDLDIQCGSQIMSLNHKLKKKEVKVLLNCGRK